MTDGAKNLDALINGFDHEATKKWLQQLTELPGAPGFEDPVRQAMYRKLDGLPIRWHRDRMGGAYAELVSERGTQESSRSMPSVLVCGHMDEVAFMVTQLTANGMIKFQPLGGWSPVVLPAQRLEVITDVEPVPGVVASTPPHLMSDSAKDKTPPVDQLLLDVGARSADELKTLGIRPGLSIVPVGPFTELNKGKRWLAKAWDNRYGVGLAAETMEYFAKQVQADSDASPERITQLPVRLFCGATVQEEVGLRGAAAAAKLLDPDICFVLDASPANDTFGGQQAFGQLGGGVLIRLMDRTMITSPRLVSWIAGIAEKQGIPYQFYTSPGGTDAGAIHQSGIGVPTAVIGICSRYIHSASSMIDPEDYYAARTLLITLIRSLTPETVRWLQTGDEEGGL